MALRFLRSADYAALAWKNGRGTAHIIASHPQGAGHDTVLWLAGTTSIEVNCPFSDLPGLDRQFMVLEGEGVELRCRGPNGDPDVRRRIDTPFEPFAFRGDWRTDCVLIGAPVRVFNVATRRGCFSAAVSVSTHGKSAALEKAAGESLLVFVAEGAIRIDGCSVSVATYDAIIADGPEAEQYSISGTSARVVVVRFTEDRATAGQ